MPLLKLSTLLQRTQQSVLLPPLGSQNQAPATAGWKEHRYLLEGTCERPRSPTNQMVIPVTTDVAYGSGGIPTHPQVLAYPEASALSQRPAVGQC